MQEDRYEHFAKRYPDLFEKSTFHGFECDAGWDKILEILFGMISGRVDTLRKRIAFYEHKGTLEGEQLKSELADEIAKLPIIVQVKEKFGELRFYVDLPSNDEAYNAKINHWIQFAEAMTSATCEECGDKGERRNGPWVRVLCDAHVVAN